MKRKECMGQSLLGDGGVKGNGGVTGVKTIIENSGNLLLPVQGNNPVLKRIFILGRIEYQILFV